MKILGWVGTALVIVAYVPQIRHLYVEKCAWGISISTWLIWLVAGALLLSYCLFRKDTLFTFVQVINITAIIATIILARRSNRICPYHVQSTLTSRVAHKVEQRGSRSSSGSNRVRVGQTRLEFYQKIASRVSIRQIADAIFVQQTQVAKRERFVTQALTQI